MADESGDFRFAGAYVELNLRDNTKAGEDEVRARIEGADDVTIGAKLGSVDVKKATEEAQAEADTKSVEIKAKVKPEVDDAALAETEAKIKAAVDVAARGSTSSSPASPTASSAADSGGGGGGAGMGALYGIGAVLGAGAIGGLTLAAIPAMFTAIGAAAEKSNPEVVQAFTDMTTSAKQTLSIGFQPLVPALVDLSGQAKSALGGLRPEFQDAASATAPLLEIVGHGFLQATQEGIGGSVPILQSLRPIAQAIGDDFVKVEQGIGGFFKNIDVSGAAQGLSILGDDLKDILPALGSVLTTVMPLGNALLGVLGPAATQTAQDLGFLRPIVQAVGSAISFLTPTIADVAPPALALIGVTKLLSGSWFDFGGAVTKVSTLWKDAQGDFDKGQSTLNALAKVMGITTDSAKAQSVAQAEATLQDAKAAAAKAALTAETDRLAAVEATEAVATDATAKNQLELTVATNTAAASQVAAAEAATVASDAEKALAAASEASTFSMGPFGIALAAIGGALTLVGISGKSSTQSIGDLTSAATSLAGAAPNAIAGLVGSNDKVAYLVNQLDKAGVSITTYQAAATGSKQAQDSLNNTIDQGRQQLNDLVERLEKSGVSFGVAGGNAEQLAEAVNKGNIPLSDQSPLLQKIVGQWNAYTDVQTASGEASAANTQQQTAEASAAAQTAQSLQLSSAQQSQATGIAAALGISIDGVTSAFKTYAANAPFAMTATQKLSDQFLTQTLAVDTANATVGNYFKQADQSLSQAQDSLSNAGHSAAQAVDAVATAQHSYTQSQQAVATAAQGVVTAQRAVQTALQGVTTAQQNETKAEEADLQAQQNLTQAKKQAAEQLISLQLQMNDQVVSEEAARAKLFDQTNASAVLGVTTQNAAQIAAEQVTDANEAQVLSAQALVGAQNSLADTLNTGVNLRDQLNTANQQGVDGNPAVVSAQQALVNAQDQVTSSAQALVAAHQAVTDAEANVTKAEQAVSDAAYNEVQAGKAVTDAKYQQVQAAKAVQTAETALQTAQDNASHSMDIHTAAGQRNIAMLQQMAQQLDANEAPQLAGNDLINNTAQLFGTSTTAAQKYLKQLGLIPQNFKYGVTAVAGVDLSALKTNVANTFTSINKFLGFSDGGLFRGVGGPKDDANLIAVSDKEFVVNAEGTARNLPLLQAINSGAVKGYASGGLVTSELDEGAALGAAYQSGYEANTVMGLPAGPSLPAYTAPVTGALAAAAAATGGQISYAASAGVAQWAPDILQALSMLSQPASWLGTVERRMNQESGGNPNAINLWDSNAAAGDPSRGLMQTIMSTFETYRSPVLPNNIYDPLANIYAGLNYALHRYGSLAALNRPGGYDEGGYMLNKPGVNTTGKPEMVLPPGMTATLEAINSAVGGRTAPIPTTPLRPVSGPTVNNYITQQPQESGYALAHRVSAQTSWDMAHMVVG